MAGPELKLLPNGFVRPLLNQNVRKEGGGRSVTERAFHLVLGTPGYDLKQARPILEHGSARCQAGEMSASATASGGPPTGLEGPRAEKIGDTGDAQQTTVGAPAGNMVDQPQGISAGAHAGQQEERAAYPAGDGTAHTDPPAVGGGPQHTGAAKHASPAAGRIVGTGEGLGTKQVLTGMREGFDAAEAPLGVQQAQECSGLAANHTNLQGAGQGLSAAQVAPEAGEAQHDADEAKHRVPGCNHLHEGNGLGPVRDAPHVGTRLEAELEVVLAASQAARRAAFAKAMAARKGTGRLVLHRPFAPLELMEILPPLLAISLLQSAPLPEALTPQPEAPGSQPQLPQTTTGSHNTKRARIFFTPIEGVPERDLAPMLTAVRQPKRPSSRPPITPFTPMEGILERPLPLPSAKRPRTSRSEGMRSLTTASTPAQNPKEAVEDPSQGAGFIGDTSAGPQTPLSCSAGEQPGAPPGDRDPFGLLGGRDSRGEGDAMPSGPGMAGNNGQHSGVDIAPSVSGAGMAGTNGAGMAGDNVQHTAVDITSSVSGVSGAPAAPAPGQGHETSDSLERRGAGQDRLEGRAPGETVRQDKLIVSGEGGDRVLGGHVGVGEGDATPAARDQPYGSDDDGGDAGWDDGWASSDEETPGVRGAGSWHLEGYGPSPLVLQDHGAQTGASLDGSRRRSQRLGAATPHRLAISRGPASPVQAQEAMASVPRQDNAQPIVGNDHVDQPADLAGFGHEDEYEDQAHDAGSQEQAAEAGGPSNEDADHEEEEAERPRPRRRTSQPNQRLRKAANSRKSLAGAGLQADHGIRRSVRQKHRPLEYWRNECKVYTREFRSLPTVSRIETKAASPSWQFVEDVRAPKKKR